MLLAEPLVRGLVKNDRPWCQYVASFLSSAVQTEWHTRDDTKAAEDGLRIQPSIYWYIRRVHWKLNRMVFFHRINRESLTPTDRGACPFDTGALWSGNTIKTGWTPEQKHYYFTANDRTIVEGLDQFEHYLTANFGGARSRYDACERPSSAIQEIVAAVAPDADWAPWTWELRVEKARVRAVTRPIGIVWTRDSSQEFENWVKSESELSKLDQRSAEELIGAMKDIELVCGKHESVYDRAVRFIMEES